MTEPDYKQPDRPEEPEELSDQQLQDVAGGTQQRPSGDFYPSDPDTTIAQSSDKPDLPIE